VADACECGNEPSGFVKCGEHLAFYNQSTTGNRISRPFRDKCRKHDISPFTTDVRETKYLAFYEEVTKCDVAMFM